MRYKKVNKEKVPSFTRPNGNRLLRLKRKDAWRKPRGLGYNRSITMPKIGYKRTVTKRFVTPKGTIPVRIFNLKEVEMFLELLKIQQITKRQTFLKIITSSTTIPQMLKKLTIVPKKEETVILSDQHLTKISLILASTIGQRLRKEILLKVKNLEQLNKINFPKSYKE